MRRLLLAAGIASALLWTASVAQEASFLPNRPGPVKFAAVGDNGTGDQAVGCKRAIIEGCDKKRSSGNALEPELLGADVRSSFDE